jgi:hypothetical protein
MRLQIREIETRQAAARERLVEELTAARGNETAEQHAFDTAVDAFMACPDLPPDPVEAMCAEYLFDGSPSAESLWDCVPNDGPTHTIRWERQVKVAEGKWRAKHA